MGAVLIDLAEFSTWMILNEETLTESQLDRLQKLWRIHHLTAKFARMLRMERAFGSWAFALPASKTPGSPGFFDLQSSLRSLDITSLEDFKFFLTSAASAWAWSNIGRYSDEEYFLDRMQTLISACDSSEKSGIWSETLQKAETLPGGVRSGQFSEILLWTVKGIPSRVICSEAVARLATTAIALRRYSLRHGDLPEKLTKLVPEYLPKVPRDPFDGNELRYRRSNQREFLLYSVGVNGIDESGNRNVEDSKRTVIKSRDIVWLPAVAP